MRSVRGLATGSSTIIVVALLVLVVALTVSTDADRTVGVTDAGDGGDGPSFFRSIVGGMEITELRIHGVSGMAPEAIIGGPVTLVAGDERAGFYRRLGRERDPSLEAFVWGGLTSGRSRQALWLLLLPFALVNVAGWMSPVGGWHGRIHAVITRLLAMCSTAVLVMVLAIAALDLVAHRGVGPVEWIPRGLRYALAALVIFAVIAFLSWLRTRTTPSPGAPPPHGDPLGSATVADDGFMVWESPTVTNMLDDLHAGFAASLVAWLLADIAGARWLGLVTLTLVTLSVAIVAIVTAAPQSVFARLAVGRLRWWKWVCLPTTIIAVALVTPLEGGVSPTPLEATSLGMFVTVVISVALAAILFVVSGSLFDTRSVGSVTSSVLGIGTGVGTGGGFLLVIFGESIRGGGRAALEWLAVVFFSTALIALAVIAIPMLTGPSQRPWVAATRAVKKVSGPLWALAAVPITVITVVLAMIVLGGGLPFGGLDLTIPPVPEGGWGWLIPLVALVPPTLAAIRHLGGPLRWTGLAAIALVVLAILLNVSHKTVAVGATLVVPAALITYVGLRARDEGLRRVVGMVWDVVTLFPRWVHPWAPPSYGESAIPTLAGRLEFLDDERPVIVSAHSQGSVIAASAVFISEPERMALLTHGSPLNTLYSWLFPRQLGTSDMDHLRDLVDERWQNLWRATDPLSKPIFDDPDIDIEVADPQPGEDRLRVHGEYETTEEYRSCILDLAKTFPEE